jgi:hypothetical protein
VAELFLDDLDVHSATRASVAAKWRKSCGRIGGEPGQAGDLLEGVSDGGRVQRGAVA